MRNCIQVNMKESVREKVFAMSRGQVQYLKGLARARYPELQDKKEEPEK